MSIRTRLTLAVAVLVVAATGGLGWVVVGAARDSMVERLDERLVDARERPPPDGYDGGRGPFGGIFGPNDGAEAPDGSEAPDETAGVDTEREPGDLRAIAELRVWDGEIVYTDHAGFGDDPEPLPVLPEPADTALADLVGRIVTLPAEDGSGELRVLTTELRFGNRGYRLLAISMGDVDATTDRLWRVFGVTTAAVAAAGAALAWFVVRRGLRPVDSMIETAGAIAAGDLSRRVDHPADNTELGRLGSALDDMLGQLEAAFDERAASEDRLKRFAADASHELRTPITAIRGYAELYRRGGLADDEALARAMARIEGESTRMGRLVEDLLLLARLDQQRPLDRVPVDLRQLVLDAAADHDALSDDHPLTVDAAVALPVVGDESGLRQVVGNLLANARTHTPAGTAVSLRAFTDGTSAVVEVADAGPGIPPEHLERVFERFHRGDPSRARATGGAGLGLSIVAALVAAHGGTASARNADGGGGDGGGAVVTVRLPLT